MVTVKISIVTNKRNTIQIYHMYMNYINKILKIKLVLIKFVRSDKVINKY